MLCMLLTLFVTVLANFLILSRSSLAHKRSEYMLSILIPSCFLLKLRAAVAGLPGRLVSIVGRLKEPGVLDRDTAERGFGVRPDVVG
jgi:hypothetical protein